MDREILEAIGDEIASEATKARDEERQMRIFGCNEQAEQTKYYLKGLRKAWDIVRKYDNEVLKTEQPLICQSCGAKIEGVMIRVRMCPVCGYIQQRDKVAPVQQEGAT